MEKTSWGRADAAGAWAQVSRLKSGWEALGVDLRRKGEEEEHPSMGLLLLFFRGWANQPLTTNYSSLFSVSTTLVAPKERAKDFILSLL